MTTDALAPKIKKIMSGDSCDSGAEVKKLKTKKLKRKSPEAENASNETEVLTPKKKKSKKDKKSKDASPESDSPEEKSNAKVVKAKEDQPAKSDTGSLSEQEFAKLHDIRVKGLSLPKSAQSFEEVGFPAGIVTSLKSAGFAAPTPIQAVAWPVAMCGRDCLAIAKTGSGKTCGYLLPTMNHILRQPMASRKTQYGEVSGPLGLVVAPTRELAIQIQEEANKFGKSLGIRSACLYGGASKGPQIKEVKYGVDLVIATPGRLLDMATMVCRFENKKILTLEKVAVLTLDEADRMLDMGFEKDIRAIVKEIPTQRQTLFFTATWPKEVQRIANDILNQPVQVNIGNSDQLNANKDVNQVIKVINPQEKYDALKKILDELNKEQRVIVFCNKKREVREIEQSLWNAWMKVGSISGDKTQDEREEVMKYFKTGEYPILIATDVAARGLDIKGVDCVVNYDFPTAVEDYVHRIGRTGRAGAKGVAYTFFTQADRSKARDLVKIIASTGQEAPEELLAMQGPPGGGSGGGNRWSGGRGGWRGGGRGGGRGRGGGGRGGGFRGRR